MSGAALMSPAVVCMFLSIALTAGILTNGLLILNSYHSQAPYHYDSAQYRFNSVEVHKVWQSSGRFAAARVTLRTKDGLDDLVRLLVWPDSLTSFQGHLVVQAPLMALFFFLLFWYCRNRGASNWGTAAAALPLLLFAPLHHPTQNIADFWKENLGIWLMGAAMLSWLLSEHGSRPSWGFLSGLLWTGLLQQRAVIAVYGGALFLPWFLYGLFRRVRQDDRRNLIRDMAAFGLCPALVLAGTAVVQGRQLYEYYLVRGYGYSTISGVAEIVWNSPLTAGWAFRGGLVAACIFSLAGLQGSLRHRAGDIAAAGWLIFGAPAIVIATHAVYHGYAHLWMVAAVVAFARLVPSGPRPMSARLATAAGVVVTIGAVAAQACHWAQTTKDLTSANAPVRAVYAGILAAMQEHGCPRLGMFFDECFPLLWNQAYYDLGADINGNVPFMSLHDSFYRAKYGDQASDPIAELIIRDLEAYPGTLAVAQADPDILKNYIIGTGKSADSRPVRVNAMVADHLRRSPHWKKIRSFDSTPYGSLAAYVLQRDPSFKH